MKFLKVVLYFYEGILGGFQKEKPEEFLKKYLKELLNETLEKLKKGKFLKKSQKDLISQRFLCLYCGLKMKTNKRSFIHEGAKFEKKTHCRRNVQYYKGDFDYTYGGTNIVLFTWVIFLYRGKNVRCVIYAILIYLIGIEKFPVSM